MASLSKWTLASVLLMQASALADDRPWPPELPGAKNGTATVQGPQLLSVPENIESQRGQEGVVAFEMAKVPPTIDFAYHRDLGPDAANRRLWSSWGDICVAMDGRVYCAIGDHGDDKNGDARCFLYCYDPKQNTLTQIVDMNKVVPPKPGRPSWSKVHAKIDEGVDGKIYFSCTLNYGNRARDPAYKFDKDLPGGQLYQYDPASGKTAVFMTLPAPRCTATSLYDRAHDTWWCNLEAGEGNALWAVNLKSKKEVFKGEDGSVGFNRAIGLAKDGSIYFNGESDAVATIEKAQAAANAATEKEKANPPTGKDAKAKARERAAEIKAELAKATAEAQKNQRTPLMKYDARSGKIVATKAEFLGTQGLRCMSQETSDGAFFGVTQSTNELFRYSTKDDSITMLGPTWLKGEYTTVMLLSPDERFLYYLPGSHGGAFKTGTPVIQYDIAKGRRKVLAFLATAFEEQTGYVPAGTYGTKLSADGGTIYVNFNGHPTESLRPDKIKPIGFGLCGFAAIHVPQSER